MREKEIDTDETRVLNIFNLFLLFFVVVYYLCEGFKHVNRCAGSKIG